MPERRDPGGDCSIVRRGVGRGPGPAAAAAGGSRAALLRGPVSEREIADALGCRPGTVKSQASAALADLRARLDANLPTREGERA